MNHHTLRLTASAVAAVALPLAGLATGPVRAEPMGASCTPSQVVVFTEAPRLQVRCEEANSGVVYFALSTNDAAQAGRVLSVIQTALVAGRTLIVSYEPNDLSGAAIGCQSQDCRLIRSIGFGK
jgi:hypothetical protein